MKRNSGSALTSAIVVFLLVTMIGVPLLSMVVYNYQLREYDSGIKEAEYKNEVVMDRIATIIKEQVITAISQAKDASTTDITSITDTLVNSYNSTYDNAYDNAVDTVAEYDGNGNITNKDAVEAEVERIMKESLKSNLGTYDGISDNSEIVEILDFEGDISSAKINDEKLQIICNSIFQHKYQNILLDDTNGIFKAIYNKAKYSNLVTNEDNIKFGNQELAVDSEGKTLASSLWVASKYERNGDAFSVTYDYGDNINASFDTYNRLEIGIESKYKLSERVPRTALSATFIIGTPNFNTISSIEQQTIALSNPVLDYGLIVGETLEVNGDVKVAGNILARANGVRKDTQDVYDKGIVMKPDSSLKVVKKGDIDNAGDGRIATSGDIIMDTDSSKTTILETGTNPIYYRNLYLGDPNSQKNSGTISVTFNGDVLAKDDLEINLNSTVKVIQNSGNYFGFNDINDEGPDSSSAIVINSSAIDNITINLDNLYLAGRAFIDGVKSTTRVDKSNNPMIYKTGESISVKGNYIAYQTPIADNGTYDVSKVKFSPYFMEGKKEGIEGSTNLTLSLVDNFINQDSTYENFDSQNKWNYFKSYVLNGGDIKIPERINIESIKYIEGIGINKKALADKSNDSNEQATMLAKGKRFDEFTSFFGYYPEDESKRKDSVKDWIKFSSNEKEAQFETDDGVFYTYISKAGAGNKKLAWGTGSSSGEDIYIHVDDNTKPINGIIIHDGDLTITNNCSSEIPFVGTIIVTGNLKIEKDVVIISDKEETSEIIIQNYLGGNGYVGNAGDGTFTGGSLAEGELFNSFTYDESGTTYVAIDVTDRSNMIDINDLVGITDWKKQSFGRL